MILGTKEDGHNVKIDLQRLTETRLLLQANSGGGKSWAIRRLLEQTHGHIQQIVLDVEDEFHTLRESLDYVLAGTSGGDCPAEVRSSSILARKLLEMQVSAIVGIYELRAHDRIRFVRGFLDAMVNAPRELWHPVLVVVDEAHIFAPQHGQAESTGAVIDLMTRGRKRGFCGVLATQRISKLHKDAAAEANNKMIGRSALDVDMKRAAEELGFTTREEQRELRTLKPGEFFCFGPALSDVVSRVKVGEVKTTHPRAGQRAVTPPPPKDKVRKVLAQLADLPKAAEEEIRTVAGLQARVRELEAKARGVPTALPAPKAKQTRIDVPVFKDAQIKRLEATIGKLQVLAASIGEKTQGLMVAINKAAPALSSSTPRDLREPWQIGPPRHRVPPQSRQPRSASPAATTEGAPMAMGSGEKKMLSALALRHHAGPLTKTQLGLLSGYAPGGGTFRTYLPRLKAAGLVEVRGEEVRLTHDGLNLVPGSEDAAPRTPEAVREMWRSSLGAGERRMLDVLIEAYPASMTKNELGERSGYAAAGGTFRTYLPRLKGLFLVNVQGDDVRADDTLFQ